MGPKRRKIIDLMSVLELPPELEDVIADGCQQMLAFRIIESFRDRFPAELQQEIDQVIMAGDTADPQKVQSLHIQIMQFVSEAELKQRGDEIFPQILRAMVGHIAPELTPEQVARADALLAQPA